MDTTGKSEQVCNGDSISELFGNDDDGTIDNGPLNGDKKQRIDEVQMFHQRTRPYDLRN